MVDSEIDSFVFEMTGKGGKIDAFIRLMTPLGLAEVSRTGRGRDHARQGIDLTRRPAARNAKLGEGTMRVYYDRDADLNLIKSKKVSVIGYGSQGFAHANNLKDSGVERGRRRAPARLRQRRQGREPPGSQVMDIEADAARFGDVVMMLTPDELQRQLYTEVLHDNMKEGAALWPSRTGSTSTSA